ncbi:MAG: hypothetical protein AAB451_02475 [Patescibacteria group bacterium]
MVLKERVEQKPVAVVATKTEVPEVFEKGMKKKTKGYLLIALGLVVLLAVGGFAFWLGQRGTDQMTSTQKAFVEQTTGLSSTEIAKIAEEGKKNAQRLLEGQSAAVVAPAVPVVPAVGFKTGNWTETFQTIYGPLKVSYNIAPTLKDAIRSKPVLEDGKLKIYLQNTLSIPVDSIAFLRWKDREGKIMGVNKPTRDFSPNEIRDIGGAIEGALSVEIKVEIN